MEGSINVNESSSKLSRTSTFSDLDEELDGLDWDSLEADSDMELDDVEGINHLIKFHMRSDVFSFPAIWAEATRTLHKDWKRVSKKRYDKDGNIDVHKLHRTDCVIMSLALLDWPYGIIKKEQSIIINSKHRERGKTGEEIVDIISRSLPLVTKKNTRFVSIRYTTTDELIKLYKSIFDQLENRSGVLVNVYPTGVRQGHAVVFAKDPYGNAVIFDAQSGVKFIEEEVEKKRGKDDMEVDEPPELVKKPVGLYGRYGIGIEEKKEQGDREQIRYLAEHFSGWGDVVLFVCSNPELEKVYSWDYEQNPPTVCPYNPETYKEKRPVGYPSLKDQLKYLGKVDVYKLKDDKKLPRKDNDPVFFGKIKKESKKKKKKVSKKDKPKKKKKPSKMKSFVSSLRNKLNSKKKKKSKGKKRKPSRTRRR